MIIINCARSWITIQLLFIKSQRVCFEAEMIVPPRELLLFLCSLRSYQGLLPPTGRNKVDFKSWRNTNGERRPFLLAPLILELLNNGVAATAAAAVGPDNRFLF